jgi:hypothetical protein
MVCQLPFQRQDRPLTTTFAVANFLEKAIAPDFENRKIRGFSFKKARLFCFWVRARLKGGADML